MKLIDKLIAKLKTDRNTFATYILTLISLYILVDRIAELLLMGFSGISYSYWGPFKYTAAIACPVFAFYFSFGSKLLKGEKQKMQFLYLYAVVLYTIVLSMVVQWLNRLSWLLLFSVPNYKYIILNFMDLIKPALTAFAWYVPICTVYPLFSWIYIKLNDTKFIRDSIEDYTGIDLSNKKEGTGPYTFELAFCKDFESGKIVKITEKRRYEATLIVGNSGTGKTSMMFEPMIARDLEKKHFLKEASKELGFTALRSGIAYLNCPYTNDYINENFSLNMISPAQNKEKIFKAYLSKLTLYYNGDNSVYKDLGLTYMAPDHESFDHMVDVAKNFGLKYYVVDPENQYSAGLNPFAGKDPVKVALLISTILKRMYISNLIGNSSETIQNNINIISQAIESLSLLLKETYPLLNEGKLPTLENLLNLFNNFDQIEELAKQTMEFPSLAEKYSAQLQYIKNTFFEEASGKDLMQKSLQSIASQIEQLLYYPGVKNILCSQSNNIDYPNVLKNGDIVMVCTRRGELGTNIHKAFGLYILLLMQQAVLTRPGIENSRIPHFLYVDEFAPFSCKPCEDIFTLYRKYRVGAIVSAQSLSQFGESKDTFRQTLLSNCTTKVTFGNNSADDINWWSDEFGVKRDWKWGSDYNTEELEYNSTYKSMEYYWKKNVQPGQLQKMPFKMIYYKTINPKGANIAGKGLVDFLESKYKEKKKSKVYNFEKFTSGISYKDGDKKVQDEKDNEFDYSPEIDPISSSADFGSSFKFNGEDPIENIKKNNN